MLVLQPEVDDGLYAQLSQARPAFIGRLPAAIEVLVYFVKVRNTAHESVACPRPQWNQQYEKANTGRNACIKVWHSHSWLCFPGEFGLFQYPAKAHQKNHPHYWNSEMLTHRLT